VLITSLIGLARNPSLLAHLDVGGRKAHRQELRRSATSDIKAITRTQQATTDPGQYGPQQKRTSFSSTVLPSEWGPVSHFGLVVFCY
jgi:hypothetical protein